MAPNHGLKYPKCVLIQKRWYLLISEAFGAIWIALIWKIHSITYLSNCVILLWEPLVAPQVGIWYYRMLYWWRHPSLGSWIRCLGSGKLGLCLLGRMCVIVRHIGMLEADEYKVISVNIQRLNPAWTSCSTSSVIADIDKSTLKSQRLVTFETLITFLTIDSISTFIVTLE